MINQALRHTNPTVRKQGEALFKLLFIEFGEIMLKKLVNQKSQLVQKLTLESKREAASKQKDQSQPSGVNAVEERKQADQQRALTQLSDNITTMPQMLQLVNGQDELLKELRVPNSKKRLIAIVEIKKIIQKKLATISSVAARDLVEPM